jgi:hypothetical protein
MKLTITALVTASAALASAQFSNDVIHTRVLNGAPTSTITVTNTFPSTVGLAESGVVNSTANPYANQDNWNLSPDGTTDAAFSATASWSLTFDLDLTSTGPTALDKEAGFWLNNSGGAGSPGQFIVKSDGEVAQFGGNLTFHEFEVAGSATQYVLGTSILMSLSYNGTTGNMTSSETYNGVTQTFTDPTTLLAGYNVGGYGLFAVDTTPGDTVNGGDAVFTNIVAAPEPASMAMLGLGVAALIRRHRKNKAA